MSSKMFVGVAFGTNLFAGVAYRARVSGKIFVGVT